ncbi:MAG: WYL domain-containing protein [Acetobacteraceae bacterium]|nr:WYL domain-containing protein [Acetobacteraceae bacterium]
MHYGKTEHLLRLAIMMQGTREGLSFADIQREFEVGRRTAERMRDAIERIFPQLERVDTGERQARFRLPAGTLSGFVAPTAEELAELEAAAATLRVQGFAGRAEQIEAAAAKLRAMSRPEHLRKLEPDLEMLLESEGVAMRPGPRPLVANDLLAGIRRAVISCLPITTTYRSARAAEPAAVTLHPLGLVYGSRPLLVAARPDRPEPRQYRLDRMGRITLGQVAFARPADFDLAAFTARAFGIWQEEPFDVVLGFAPAVAEEAGRWRFHPSQTLETEADGGLIVRFRAGGATEIAWHLFTWGAQVSVLAPESLRLRTTELLAEALRHHGGGDDAGG